MKRSLNAGVIARRSLSGYVPPPDSTPVILPDTLFPPIDSVPPDSGGGGMPPEPPDTAGPPVEPPEPPPPPTCTVIGLYSMRTLIAWEPERMNEVVRLVAHIGTSAVNPDVPDVMTELRAGGVAAPPGSTPPDSGSGSSGGEPGGWPGFMGEYLVRNLGSWLAFEGNQSNELEETTGACTEDRSIIDWAEFGCDAAQIRFGFAMGVEPLDHERPTGQPRSRGAPHHRDGVNRCGRSAAQMESLDSPADARYDGGKAVTSPFTRRNPASR